MELTKQQIKELSACFFEMYRRHESAKKASDAAERKRRKANNPIRKAASKVTGAVTWTIDGIRVGIANAANWVATKMAVKKD